MSGAKVDMKNPDGMAYPPPGNARNAMKPHVTKTPSTPKIDTGASAANDDKLQSGSNVQAVVTKMDAWRVAQNPCRIIEAILIF